MNASTPESDEFSCPIPDFTTQEAPIGARATAGVVTAFFLGYVVVFTALAVRHRNEFPLNQHPISFRVVGAVGISISTFTSSLREAVGRPDFPCDAFLLGQLAFLPLSFLPVLAVITRAHFLYKFQLQAAGDNNFLHARLSGLRAYYKGGMLNPIAARSQTPLTNSVRTLAPEAPNQESEFKLVLQMPKNNAVDQQRVTDLQIEFRRLAFLKSTRLAAVMLIAALVFILVTIVVVAIQSEAYFNGCRGCRLAFAGLVCFGAIGALLFAMVSFLVYISWHETDSSVLSPARRMMLAWGIVLVVWLPFEFIDPWNIERDLLMTWSYIWLLGGMVPMFTWFIALPTLETMRLWSGQQDTDEKGSRSVSFDGTDTALSSYGVDDDDDSSSNTGSASLASVGTIPRAEARRRRHEKRKRERMLRDKELSLRGIIAVPEYQAAFKQYLISEFAVENLEFYLQATTWRQFQARFDPQLSANNAVDLYDYYVKEGAMFQVNLAHRIRLDCAESVERVRTELDNPNVTVAPSIFNECIDAAYLLMNNDSYPRFKRSKFYRELVENVSGGGKPTSRWFAVTKWRLPWRPRGAQL